MITEDRLCQWHREKLEEEARDRAERAAMGNLNPFGGGGGSGARQCGYRKEGGIYATVPSAPGGRPVEYFTLCPPMPIDKGEYQLKDTGVKLIDLPDTCLTCGGGGQMQSRDGGLWHRVVCATCGGTGLQAVTHIFDIVGMDNYPNIADFLEEARRMGVSRRLELESADQYARLSPRSRLYLLHRRAIIENPGDLWARFDVPEREAFLDTGCPKHKADHCNPAKSFIAPPPDGRDMCAGLYWHTIEGGEETGERLAIVEAGVADFAQIVAPDRLTQYSVAATRKVRRKIAAGTYTGYRMPEPAPEDFLKNLEPLRFGLGVFAVFPLGKIEVVDPNGKYQKQIDKVTGAGVPYSVENS